MTTEANRNVVICGGGNGAHVTAGLVSMVNGTNVIVVTVYEDESEKWTSESSKHGFCVSFANSSKLFQPAEKVRFKVSKSLSDAVPNADIVIICVPAYVHKMYLESITSLISDKCLVVGMPGQPGFEFQCLSILRENNKKCSVMSLETLPWACRINSYGSEVTVFGTKDEVEYSFIQQTADHDGAGPDTLQKLLGTRPVLTPVDHVLQLMLLSKPSIHPPIMYSRWKDWDGQPLDFQPLFYQGVDEASVACLDAVSEEINSIAGAVKKKFPSLDISGVTDMHRWLVDHYGDQIDDKTSLLSSLKTNRAYDGLCHPMTQTTDGRFVPNFGYRYITEDVPYGLIVLRQLAEMVGVETPATDEVITWAQEKMGEQFLVDGRFVDGTGSSARLPSNYGIKTIEDLMDFIDCSN